MNGSDQPVALTDFADIDRSGPIPLYFQVASRIESAILNGTLPPGARLENEIALGERLNLSRPTIRRAIQDLVDKGLVVRRRGIGTQVVHGGVTRKVELTSLYEDLESSNRSPFTQLLSREVVSASEKVAADLGVETGSEILHVRRLRGADGIPIAVLENYLPSEFTDISAEDLTERALYAILRSRGVTLRVARQRIGARNASALDSQLLDIERHGALLTMERIAYDNSGRAVEAGQHIYRPDLYSFEVTLVDK